MNDYDPIGLEAECFFCHKTFVKSALHRCPKCELYICTHCRKCGCDLSECCREVARICIDTFKRYLERGI